MNTKNIIKFSILLILIIIFTSFIWPTVFYNKFVKIGKERIVNVASSLNALDIPDKALKTCIENAAKQHSDINPLNSGGIDNVQQLFYLNCFRANIVSLRGLSNLKQLQQLDLQMNKIKDISQIKSLTNLTVLNLKDNPIDSIEVLRSLKKLRQVYLPDLPDIYCYKIITLVQSMESNAKSIYCRGKYSRKIQSLLYKQIREDILEPDEQKLLSDYRYNLALMSSN